MVVALTFSSCWKELGDVRVMVVVVRVWLLWKWWWVMMVEDELVYWGSAVVEGSTAESLTVRHKPRGVSLPMTLPVHRKSPGR